MLARRLIARAETQVLTVMIIQNVVSPTANLRADEMFAHMEIQQYDGALRLQYLPQAVFLSCRFFK